MPSDSTDFSYVLNKGLELNGVVGWEFPLYSTMFRNSFSESDSGVQVNVLYNLVNCHWNYATKSITPIHEGAFSFSLNREDQPTITGYAKYSMQPPMLMSEIAQYTGFYSLVEACLSTQVNPYSRFKPDKIAPHSMGEFIGYCPTAETGGKIVGLGTTSNNIIGYDSPYILYAQVQQREVSSILFGIDIYVNNILVSTVRDVSFDGKYHYELLKNTYSPNLSGLAPMRVDLSIKNDTNVYTVVDTKSINLEFQGSPSTLPNAKLILNDVTKGASNKEVLIYYSAENNETTSVNIILQLITTYNAHSSGQFKKTISIPPNSTIPVTMVVYTQPSSANLELADWLYEAFQIYDTGVTKSLGDGLIAPMTEPHIVI